MVTCYIWAVEGLPHLVYHQASPHIFIFMGEVRTLKFNSLSKLQCSTVPSMVLHQTLGLVHLMPKVCALWPASPHPPRSTAILAWGEVEAGSKVCEGNGVGLQGRRQPEGALCTHLVLTGLPQTLIPSEIRHPQTLLLSGVWHSNPLPP